MRTVTRALALLLALSAVLLVSSRGRAAEPPPAPGQRQVTVAAAADLSFALAEIISSFHRRHPDIAVKVTYGSSGTFFSQLSNKAPFDLFLSADLSYPEQLVQQGLASKETEFEYAVGRIVVWVRNDSQLDLAKLGIRALVEPSVKKVAIANPQHAPYGRAAAAAMKQLGVYDQAKDRLVLGENIAETAQFVDSGAADVGVIALALALAPAMKDKGRYWEVPLDAYPRIEQGGVILSWAKDIDAARQLRDFMVSAEGRAILERYGFFLPEPGK